MGKYRFKTKKEFIRDGLWDEEYNCPDKWNFDGEMNKYLGKDVPDEFNIHCDENEEFKYDGWLFQNTDYVLKEQQKYFDDLSQHIGRYIKALVDNPHSGSKVKKGDIGKIITRCQVDFPNRKSYSCTCALSKDYLGVKYELLPEDYSPEQENKEPNIEFIPGKWYKWYKKDHSAFHYGKFDSITDGHMRMKPWIMRCKTYSESGSFYRDQAQQITEVSYSEIEQFLPEDMKETKEFPKYWFVKNNKQPELLEYAGYISKESPKWWEKYTYIGYDGVYCCNGMHGCPQSSFLNDAIEVSFEEFLENVYYTKFPEKRKQTSEFVLPEKWYTKPKTNEEKDVLNKFVVDLKDNHWKIEDKHSYKHTPHFKNGNYQRSTWIGCEDNDYTEITFEQFKKYVLKDKSVTPTDTVKYVMSTSEEAVFVSTVVESVPISILNVEDSKILPLPKSIESVKTKLN